ncbi:MAG: DUF1499 domain-containing protein [Ardenticatenaceae bacterium]|nr:DUF1499 domain-containing protein [Ardenticatenaceae bacterium]MCB8991358.1 DUF1499 domain-containing protein [Ardenticatenaceae bacterium]MCB9005580.1 DUF1499 domain-containing protein [Ardenticatenaceae bacterium]
MRKLIVPILVVVLVGFFVLRWVVQKVSPVPQSLGVENGRFSPCPSSPNCVSTFASDEPHHIDPLTFSVSLPEAKVRMYNVITAMPRVHVISNTPNYIHAEYRSALWRFVDDVEFYFDEENGLIQMKSASRLGYADGGVNRARMKKIAAQFENGG